MRSTLTLVALLVALLTATAAATCTVAKQFDSTYVIDPDTGGGWITGLNGTMTASCTTKWRVVFHVECKTGHTNYASCIQNELCNSPGICEGVNGWGAGTSHLYDPTTEQPGGAFTGYWTPGDGLQVSRPLCDYIWRVRERFYNTIAGTLITTKYSPEGAC